MQTIAFILPHTTVYYSGLILSLAALGSVSLLLGLRQRQGAALTGSAVFALLSLLLAVPCSRLVHWYCNTVQYSSFTAAMTDYSVGGYSSLGAAAAVLLSALLLRAAGIIRDLPALLDCAAPAGALALCIGRMACLFSADDRSKFTLQGEFFRRLPFMVSSTLPSGGTEWRIATFALESISCGVMCVLFLLLFRRLRTAPRGKAKWQDGNVFLLFIGLYGAVTVVLDSTRYDALYLRSNGFVSVTQICCLASLVLGTVLYSVRSIQCRGLRKWHFALWASYLAAAGIGGYMEYVVQRHNDRFLSAYTVMESCFLLLFALECILCRSTRPSDAAEGDFEAVSPKKEKKKHKTALPAADAESIPEKVPPKEKKDKSEKERPVISPASEEAAAPELAPRPDEKRAHPVPAKAHAAPVPAAVPSEIIREVSPPAEPASEVFIPEDLFEEESYDLDDILNEFR